LPNRPKLLIIDGHSLAYRAFHALPVDKFHSPQGIPVNAVYGLCSMLINLLMEHKPEYLAVCFDEGRDTFRKKLFPSYKANRAKSPDEFRAQVSLIRNMIDSFGITSFSDSQYEADDLIATLTKKSADDNLDVLIVTSDRDSFQLISDSVNVLYPKKGLSDVVIMNRKELQDKYGLSPEQYPDFAALRGDPSDNLPGIPGVGEKTALAWIQKYGSLDNLIESKDEIPGKVGESLRANIEVIRTNLSLTHLVSNVALHSSVTDLKWEPGRANQALIYCTELGFKSLLPRLKSLLGDSELGTKEDKPKKLSPKSVLILDDTRAFILKPSGFQTIEYKSISELEKILKDLADLEDAIVSDLKFIARRFLELDGRLSKEQSTRLLDILVLEYLSNPGTRPQLEDLMHTAETGQLFSESGNENEICSVISSNFHKLSNVPEFTAVLELYKNLESAVTLVLAEMEHNGIAIDSISLKEMIDIKAQEQLRLEVLGYEVQGREFNFGSPKQLQDVLFVERGLSKTKKTKTGYTTDADALVTLIEKHPDDDLLPIIQEWRETSKIRQMLISLLEATQAGRIHTTFMQTIAATGRLSSTKPNLQNVPVRTEAGKAIRGLFVSNPPYGNLITADYSQIELRVMAHLAKDSALIAAFESGEDLHKSVASQIFDLPISEITPEIRNQIKAVSYGLAYGLSAYGLSQGLRIDVSDADKLMSKFFERFDGVRRYLKEIVEQARQNGYTESILGRRRYLPELNHENRFRREIAERAALNAPIQGSAADIIKLAMINLNEAIIKQNLKARLLLQVHDELVLETDDEHLEEVKSLTKNIMENVIKLSVPLDVSVGSGVNWLAAAH